MKTSREKLEELAALLADDKYWERWETYHLCRSELISILADAESAERYERALSEIAAIHDATTPAHRIAQDALEDKT